MIHLIKFNNLGFMGGGCSVTDLYTKMKLA
jgi:hypothetical protein